MTSDTNDTNAGNSVSMGSTDQTATSTPSTETPDTSANTPAPQSEVGANTAPTADAPATATPAETAVPASSDNPNPTPVASPTSVPSVGGSDNGSSGGGGEQFSFEVNGAKEASTTVPAGTTYADAFKKATGVTPASTHTYREGSESAEVDFKKKVTGNVKVTAVVKTRAG